ncbi:MAG TPA: efflux RND transporter permease subunit [Deltaproteobacteria bacterium]|nr:efflux RND transporter permease subunit [Deltaproteobacteria bacterium]HOM28315.1 efflux RND transporter permease subunit [Deltaproteobacteria bacterium]HPP79318.1 efflux RND transporter permease subunit [Deltaproteobacteria bacterium]
MNRLLGRMSEFIVRQRVAVLAVTVAVTCVMVFMIATRITVNNDHDTWLPKHNEVAKLLRQADEDFSSNVMLFAVIEFKDGVFKPENLAVVDRITKELEKMDELFNVTSVTNIIDIKKTQDGIEVSDLVRSVPKDGGEALGLRDYVMSKETYVNTVVSADERFTCVMTNIKSDLDEVKVAEKIYRTIDTIAGGHVRYYGGDPSVNYYLNYYMVEDLKKLLPLGVIVVMTVIFLGLRRVSGVVLPMTIVAFAIVWTFGLQAIFSFPVNILSPAVVVLLIALGTDYAVHYYNHHMKRGDVRTSTAEISLPVTMSAFTTIVSLLTFATTRIEVFKNFGLELAFGLAAAWILSIVLMAVFIAIFKVNPQQGADDEGPRQTTFTRATDSLGAFVQRHAKAILVVVGLASVGMAFGVPRISTNVDFIGQLPKDSPPRRGCDILQEHFSGMYPFNLYVRADIQDPAVMNRMQYLENCMRTENGASGFTSINALIAQENWLLNGVYAIPETREGIANLWFMLEGHDVLKTFVTEGRDKALVNSIVNESSTEDMRFVADRLDAILQGRLSEEIVTVDPSRLTEEGRGALEKVMIRDAAEQVAWLARYYDKKTVVDPLMVEEALTKALHGIEGLVDVEAVRRDVEAFLKTETVEILPEALVAGIMERVGGLVGAGLTREAADDIEGMIVASGAMGAEDAKTTVEGMSRRLDSSLRIQKAVALAKALTSLIPEGIRGNENFVKRTEGVLWGLFSPRPVMFSRQVESVPGISGAIAGSVRAKIDQAGMPATVRLVHHLLISSQVQSLVLAICAVLVMVSLAHRSLRRGLASMLTVLVPLVFILGFMGLVGMPLDIGTVLCGSLIVGLGIDGSIHFLHYYSRLHEQGTPKDTAIRMTMGHVGKAVCTANGTTLAGFLVCLISDVTAVRNFATLNSIAIVFVTASVMTLLPALVTILHLDRMDDVEEGSRTGTTTVFRLRRPACKGMEKGEEERKAARAAGG